MFNAKTVEDKKKSPKDPLKTALETPPSGIEDLSGRPDADIISKRFPVPGLESYLGRGYAILDGYATPDAVRMPVFDLTQDTWVEQQTLDKSIQLDPDNLSKAFITPPAESKLIYRRPSKVGYTDYFKADTEVVDVKTTDGHDTNWGIGGDVSGSYLGFSADLKARFDSKMTQLASARMATATAKIVYWKLDLTGYSLSAPPPIRKETKDDFDSRTVQELMKAYGTHCVMSFGMGSKISMHYLVDTSKFSQEINLKASLTSAYTGRSITAGVNIDGAFQDIATKDEESMHIEIQTDGVSDIQLDHIDPQKGLADHPLKMLQQGWHNPTLIQLYPNSLRPLWEIEGLMKPEKAAEFKNAFEQLKGIKSAEMSETFAGLQPLYLFSTGSREQAKYRFSIKAHYKGGNGTEWMNVLAEMQPVDAKNPKPMESRPGKPWLLISAVQKEGMVGLFEFALNDDTDIVRYETDTWIAVINKDKDKGYEWKKVSSKPLGYVYEVPEISGSALVLGDPVYAYYDKSFDPAHGIFYSAMKEIVWDQGRWVAAPEFRYSSHEVHKYFQKILNEQWENSSFFYRLIHDKPDAGSIGFGYVPGEAVNSIMLTPGLAHWYAMDGIVTNRTTLTGANTL